MKTILLVEDEPIIARTEAKLLKNNGYMVITAGDAVKAIGAVNEQAIDLVLMDIDLGHGNMDGTEASQVILQDHMLPIVFLTSHAEKEMVDKVKGITRYGYVIKNSGEFVLLEAISMAFELFEAHMQTRRHEQELEHTVEELETLNRALRT